MPSLAFLTSLSILWVVKQPGERCRLGIAVLFDASGDDIQALVEKCFRPGALSIGQPQTNQSKSAGTVVRVIRARPVNPVDALDQAGCPKSILDIPREK